MKRSILLLFFWSVLASAQTSEKDKINQMLDTWHKAAADAKLDAYFDLMTADAIFIGTDATENWNKKDFKVWAKPFFDRGKAWHFTALERHIYFDKTENIAWFDELLNTQMKICRGSGVLIKVGEEWKIQHYVLSMTIPNANAEEVIKIKSAIEDVLIEKLHKK